MAITLDKLNKTIKSFKNRAVFRSLDIAGAEAIRLWIQKEVSFLGRKDDESFGEGIKALTNENEVEGQFVFGESIALIDDTINFEEDYVTGDDYTLVSTDISKAVNSTGYSFSDGTPVEGYTWSRTEIATTYTGDQVINSVSGNGTLAVDSDQTFYPFLTVGAGSIEGVDNMLRTLEGKSVISALTPTDYEPRDTIRVPGRNELLNTISPFNLEGES